MASLNQRILGLVPMMVPPPSILDAAAALIDPLMHRMDANRVESHILAELRGILLPKLISGELRVPEAEHAVAEAG